MLEREIEPGRTLVLASTFSLAARLAAERHGLPCVAVQLSPSWFRSEYMAPSFGPLGHLTAAPRWLKRGLYRVMDRRLLDPLFTEPFNRVRAGLGLPPVQRMLHAWIHQADLTLGLFPDWFAVAQPDWPAGVVLSGFPLAPSNADEALPPQVEAFLAAGPAPVAFTTGTANAVSHAFFEQSAQACVLAGRRGILLTRDKRQLPAALPPGVVHVDYAAFRSLLPRLAAFVHHGGIGTVGESIRAGVPQLIRPMAFDQFDNARRAVQLGVALQLPTRRYDARSAARALRTLADDTAMQQRCTALARRLQGEDGIGAACNAIERLASQARTKGPVAGPATAHRPSPVALHTP